MCTVWARPSVLCVLSHTSWLFMELLLLERHRASGWEGTGISNGGETRFAEIASSLHLSMEGGLPFSCRSLPGMEEALLHTLGFLSQLCLPKLQDSFFSGLWGTGMPSLDSESCCNVRTRNGFESCESS